MFHKNKQVQRNNKLYDTILYFWWMCVIIRTRFNFTSDRLEIQPATVGVFCFTFAAPINVKTSVRASNLLRACCRFCFCFSFNTHVHIIYSLQNRYCGIVKSYWRTIHAQQCNRINMIWSLDDATLWTISSTTHFLYKNNGRISHAISK